MKTLLFLVLIIVGSNTSSFAQNLREIPYHQVIEVETPISYKFRAGSKYIEKTAYVKILIPDFKVVYQEIDNFIKGGAMGVTVYDLTFIRWISFGEINSVIVDGETIPISAFSKDGSAGTIYFNGLSFIWYQGEYQSLSKWSLGSPFVPARSIQPGKKPDYAANSYELKEFMGTDTNQQGKTRLEQGGGIIGKALNFESVEFVPTYELKTYLTEKDERIAIETGYYTVNGFTNKVTDSNSTTLSSSTASSQNTTTESTTNSEVSSEAISNENRKREEADRNRKIEQSKKDLATAGVGFASGISNGSINVGVRIGSGDTDYKGTTYPTSYGIMFGIITGYGVQDDLKNSTMTLGFITYASLSKDYGLDAYDNDDYNFKGQIISFGATMGVGIFKIVEFLPSVGLQWIEYSFNPGSRNNDQDSGFTDAKFSPTIGVMGRLGNAFYTVDYNTLFKSYELGLGFHFGRN